MYERRRVRSLCRWVFVGCLLLAVPFARQATVELRARFEPYVDAMQREPDAFGQAQRVEEKRDWLPPLDLVTVAFGGAGVMMVAAGVAGLRSVWLYGGGKEPRDYRWMEAQACNSYAASSSAQQDWLDRLSANRDRPHRAA